MEFLGRTILTILLLCSIKISMSSNKELNNFRSNVMPYVYKYEGEYYHNYKWDPGGPTKYGITLSTYRALIDRNADAFILKHLTKEDASLIYFDFFWLPNNDNLLTNKMLAKALFLAQINLGSTRPNRLLQDFANDLCNYKLAVDGILGYESITAINKCSNIWPGYPYVLFYLYYNNLKGTKLWDIGSAGFKNRIFFFKKSS